MKKLKKCKTRFLIGIAEFLIKVFITTVKNKMIVS